MSNVTQAIREWSKYQLAIFTFIVSGVGSAIIEAVAGSGKTTTIVEAYNYTKSLGNAIFLAFNKAIADELQKRGLNARTFHSMCFSVVLKFKRAHKATPDKIWQIIDAKLNGDDKRMYGAFIKRLVSLGKQAGIGCLEDDTAENWVKLVDHHDIELESQDADFNVAIKLTQDLLRWSNESNMVDFDDMLYLAVKEGLTLPKYDFVFVDEAQDTNAIQRAILRKIMKPTSRMIAVGDPAQAIYGFRGADSDSLELIAKEFNCTRLPLTVSYRCPTAIVQYAQQWVKHIEAAPNAPAGTVVSLGQKWDIRDFKTTDMVVCRTTKPLISLGYKMLKARMPVHIKGKDIGEGLKSLVKRMQPKGIEGLIEKLGIWSERECQKALAKQDEAKMAAIQDKYEAIMCIIAGMDENNRTVPALLDVLDNLFSDKTNCTTLSTIHKAKGLEAKRVFWLNRGNCPAQWAKQEWQRQQEVNLCYVATTRAMEELVTIEEPKDGDRDPVKTAV